MRDSILELGRRGRTIAWTLCALIPLACAGSKQDTASPGDTTTTSAPTEPTKPPVEPIPAGFFALTPQITVPDVDAALEFYNKAFGAEKTFAMPGPDQKTMHAEMKIGDSLVMLDKETPESKGPAALGGTPATLMMYVPNADEAFATAQQAGAKVDMPLEDQFWGDRYGELVDPFGHRWAIATHKEDLTPEQMQQRATAAMAEMPKPGKKPKKKKGDPAWKKIAGTPASKAVPDEYHTVTVALRVDGAAEAIEFYKKAFGATERNRMPTPDGKLMHAEVQIGNSVLMLSDAMPEMGAKSAKALGGSPVALHYYVTNADEAFAAAKAAGGTEKMPLQVMFWGDRYGGIVDPAGYYWGVATHVEDVTPEQMQQRMQQQMQQQPPPAAPASSS